MNKEFMIVSDENIVVSDENGHISKKEYTNNVEEILISENKLEIVDNKLKELKKLLEEQEGLTFVSKNMLIAQPIIFVVVSLAIFIYGGVTSPTDFLTYALYKGMLGLASGTIITGTWASVMGIINKKYKKKINKTKKEIEIVEKLKEDYKQELTEAKEKTLEIDEPVVTMNESVALQKSTEFLDSQIDEQIYDIYNESLNEKPKKLVLTRKK